MMRALQALASENISIDLLKIGAGMISFIIEEGTLATTTQVIEPLGYTMTAIPGRALLSVMAANMREMVGVMVTIADALQKAGAVIEQTGDAHDRVMVLIDGAKTEAAIAQLQIAFEMEGAAR